MYRGLHVKQKKTFARILCICCSFHFYTLTTSKIAQMFYVKTFAQQVVPNASYK